ncbi:MAG: DUF975 family protein, partial [Oscillospiraceae bacterium]|nr:DUF975 family protein [Oscillospiraceae bacterium]
KDLIEAKVRDKTSIRQAQHSAMRVTLVFLLLTTVLSMVVGYLTFDPMDVIWELVAVLRYQVDEAVEYVWKNYANQIWLYMAINAVLGIYTTVMSFGYTSYGLRLSRNEAPELSHIFDGFLKLLRVLWMNLLKGIFVTLWILVGMIPAAALALVGYVTEMDYYAFSSTYILAVVLAVVVGMMVSYRYCLSDYFLLDDPSRTARQCIRESKKAMRGWKMERFTLDISFLGWMICGQILVSSLSVIWYPAGVIGMLVFNAWYLPYVGVTTANFYNSVSGRTDPFHQSSEWEDRMKDLQDSFDKPEL